MNQFPLKERSYESKSGEQKVMRSVELEISDGCSTMYVEAIGDRADRLNARPLNKGMLYRFCVTAKSRNVLRNDGGESHFTSLNLTDWGEMGVKAF